MSNEDALNLLVASDGFKVVNHNETNFEGFHSFQERMEKVYAKTDEDRTRSERSANLRKWDAQLASPWNQARLNQLSDTEAVAQVLAALEKDPFSSFFLKGEKGTGKTFMALAIARRFIGRGFVSPSQVKHISEESIINIARSGFKASDRVITELLDPKVKLYIIDNVGHAQFYDANTVFLWSQLLEWVSKRNLNVIFTSQFSARKFAEMLSENTQSKFSFLVQGRIITMSGVNTAPPLLDEPTEREQEELSELEGAQATLSGFKGTPRRVKKK